MWFKILEIIFYTSLVSIALPLGILLSRIKHQPLGLKWLAAFLSFDLFTEVLGRAFYFIGINPNIVGILSLILSCSLLSLFFYNSIEWKSLKVPVMVINIVYFLFAVSNALFIQKMSHNSYTQTLLSFIILFFSILFFYKLMKELPVQQINKLPLFWIVSGFFFSTAGKLVIYITSHYLIHTRDDNMIIVWTFHNFLTIPGNILILVGVLLQNKQLFPDKPGNFVKSSL